MPTLLAATRLAWEQAEAWDQAVYVVERPHVPVAAPVELRHALHIRRMYLRATGQPVPAMPAFGPPSADDADCLTFDTMPATEVQRRIRDGHCPALLRVAYPDGRVAAVADPSGCDAAAPI
jgi:hypothetical protein